MINNLTINRRYWGVGKEGGALLNCKTNKKCCLGFFCEAAGFSHQEINGVGMPAALLYSVSKKRFNLQRQKLAQLLNRKNDSNNRIAGLLSTVNDSISTLYKNPVKREARITKLFAQLGVKVNFIN